MSKIPLSVVIITYNEERIIEKTLKAVRDLASEIIVVDSYSTDRTVEIAKSLDAKVFVEKWRGYSEQKNLAMKKCNNEWIFFIDADEIVSDDLKKSIVKELKNPKADGYMVNRRTYYMGKFLKRAWQPEWRLRLVRKSAGPWWSGDVHEQLHIRKGKIGKLRGDLYHFPYRDFADHVRKVLLLSREVALARYRSGERCGFLNLIFNPIWAFWKTFLIKGGFFDGIPGLVASFMTMVYTFFKYAFMYELQLREKKGGELWKN